MIIIEVQNKRKNGWNKRKMYFKNKLIKLVKYTNKVRWTKNGQNKQNNDQSKQEKVRTQKRLELMKKPDITHQRFVLSMMSVLVVPAGSAVVVEAVQVPAEVWTLLHVADRTQSILDILDISEQF